MDNQHDIEDTKRDLHSESDQQPGSPVSAHKLPLVHSISVASHLGSYPQARSQSSSPWLTRKPGHEPIEIVSHDYDYIIMHYIKSNPSLRYKCEENLCPKPSDIEWPEKPGHPLTLRHGSCSQMSGDVCRDDLRMSWESFYLLYEEFTEEFPKEMFDSLMGDTSDWMNYLPSTHGKVHD